MKNIKTYLIYKISLIIMVCFFVGCDLDVVNKFYNDFESLKEENYQIKGWLPNELCFNSLTNLYHRSDLDVNTFMLRFNLPPNDIALFKSLLSETDISFKKPHRLCIPKWWDDKVDNFIKFEYKKNGYVYYYAIDDLNGIIYSWGGPARNFITSQSYL